MNRRAFLLAGGGAMLACGRRRGSGFPGYAFVANRDSRSVGAVDLGTFTFSRQIPVEGQPELIVSHPSQPLVYALVPASSTVYDLDPGELKVRRKLRPGRAAVTMRLAPDGKSLWVLCREPWTLINVDLKSFRIETRLPLTAAPADFDLSPDGALAGLSFPEIGAVAFAHLAERRVGPPVELRRRTGLVRFRSDSRQLMAANAQERFLSMIDAGRNRLMAHLPLAVTPERLCLKADGGQLFITGAGMDAVVIVFPYRTEVAETILAGKAPAGMAVSTSPDYLLVSNPATGDVTIIDVDSRRVIALVTAGEGAGHIVITPDNQYALVLNERSGNMAVIRLPTIVARRTKAAALFTIVPVGPGPVNAAVCRA